MHTSSGNFFCGFLDLGPSCQGLHSDLRSKFSVRGSEWSYPGSTRLQTCFSVPSVHVGGLWGLLVSVIQVASTTTSRDDAGGNLLCALWWRRAQWSGFSCAVAQAWKIKDKFPVATKILPQYDRWHKLIDLFA